MSKAKELLNSVNEENWLVDPNLYDRLTSAHSGLMDVLDQAVKQAVKKQRGIGKDHDKVINALADFIDSLGGSVE